MQKHLKLIVCVLIALSAVAFFALRNLAIEPVEDSSVSARDQTSSKAPHPGNTAALASIESPKGGEPPDSLTSAYSEKPPPRDIAAVLSSARTLDSALNELLARAYAGDAHAAMAIPELMGRCSPITGDQRARATVTAEPGTASHHVQVRLIAELKAFCASDPRVTGGIDPRSDMRRLLSDMAARGDRAAMGALLGTRALGLALNTKYYCPEIHL